MGPRVRRLTRDVSYELGVTAAYNHAISSLTLSEIYGMGQRKEAAQLSASIKKALAATLEMQRWPKDQPHDLGGWRYIVDEGPDDSDLSITGWHLMFLRSARNAGFEVGQEPIDDAVKYVRRTFDSQYRTFGYSIRPVTNRSRAMAGAGILALAHAGFHNSTEAKTAAQWLLEHSLDDYNTNIGIRARPVSLQLVQLLPGDVPDGQSLLGEVLPAHGRRRCSANQQAGRLVGRGEHPARPAVRQLVHDGAGRVVAWRAEPVPAGVSTVSGRCGDRQAASLRCWSFRGPANRRWRLL